MGSRRAREIDSIQGVFVVGGFMLGVVPLVKVLLLKGSPGLLSMVLPAAPSASHWIVPLVVLLGSVASIVVLEEVKQRR